jgi:hypothetical protein
MHMSQSTEANRDRNFLMTEHNLAPIVRRPLRRLFVGMAGVAAPVVLMCALTAGTASAAESHHGHQTPGGGFTPTTPVDAFADHWEKYHKGKDATQEPKTIMSDPGNYMKIHQEMAQHMLGQ